MRDNYCDQCGYLEPSFEGWFCRKYCEYLNDSDDSGFLKPRLKKCKRKYKQVIVYKKSKINPNKFKKFRDSIKRKIKI